MKKLVIAAVLIPSLASGAWWDETNSNPDPADTVMINDTSQPEGDKTQYTSFRNFPVSDKTQAEIDTKGQVNSIVAGDNVTVDNTDPANPVVSSTGSGGDLPSDPVFNTVTSGEWIGIFADNTAYIDIYNSSACSSNTSPSTSGRLAYSALDDRFCIGTGSWSARYLLDSNHVGSIVEAYDTTITRQTDINSPANFEAYTGWAAGGDSSSYGSISLTTDEIAAGACGTTVSDPVSGAVAGDSLNYTLQTSAIGTDYTKLDVLKSVTAGNVNFTVCNNTAAPITPPAMDLTYQYAVSGITVGPPSTADCDNLGTWGYYWDGEHGDGFSSYCYQGGVGTMSLASGASPIQATCPAGEDGDCLLLNEDDENASFPSPGIWSSAEGTIKMRVYPVSTAATAYITEGRSDAANEFYTRISTNGTVRQELESTTNGATSSVSSNAVNVGAWNDLTVAWNAAGASISVNGTVTNNPFTWDGYTGDDPATFMLGISTYTSFNPDGIYLKDVYIKDTYEAP